MVPPVSATVVVSSSVVVGDPFVVPTSVDVAVVTSYVVGAVGVEIVVESNFPNNFTSIDQPELLGLFLFFQNCTYLF